MPYTREVLDDLLKNAAIERSDAEILLAYVLQKDRAWLLAHSVTSLSPTQEKEFQNFVARRKKHEPIAYILGEKEFYGRKFFVDRRVLIPRPSTEVLIDEVKRFWRAPQHDLSITPADSGIVIFSRIKKNQHDTVSFSIIDVGTGSGCIGITLALEIPDAKILCTDISEDALDVAKENAKRFDVLDRISFQKANFIPANEQTRKPENFLVVSNPPYIPTSTPLPADVLHFEPYEALFAGEDGMDVLEPLYEECMRDSRCVGCVFECREEQAKKLMK